MCLANRIAVVSSLVLLLSTTSQSTFAGTVRCPDTSLGLIDATERGLRVAEAHAGELRDEDIVLQLNSHLLPTCAALDEALAEARNRNLALLLLIARSSVVRSVLLRPPTSRAGIEPQTPVAQLAPPASVSIAPEPSSDGIEPAAPSPDTAAVIAAPALPTAPAPKHTPEGDGENQLARDTPHPLDVRHFTPSTVSLSAADRAIVQRELDNMLAFGRRLQDALPLLSPHPWVDRIDSLVDAHTETRTRVPATKVLDPILGYYTTVAEILTYKQAETESFGPARYRSDLVLEYGNDSRVGAWLQRYDFLSPSVVRPPVEVRVLATGEDMGRWSPNEAIRLLVGQALADGAALAVQIRD